MTNESKSGPRVLNDAECEAVGGARFDRITTLAIGEEDGGGRMTTLAVGEEDGGVIRFPSLDAKLHG
jgi:hypothetical protein